MATLGWITKRSHEGPLYICFFFWKCPVGGLLFSGICDSIHLGIVFAALMLPWISATIAARNVSLRRFNFL